MNLRLLAGSRIKRGAGRLDGSAPSQSAFDLRKFPSDEKTRFVNVLMRGKNAMPPLGGLFGADEIDALWAYVVAGEKR